MRRIIDAAKRQADSVPYALWGTSFGGRVEALVFSGEGYQCSRFGCFDTPRSASALAGGPLAQRYTRCVATPLNRGVDRPFRAPSSLVVAIQGCLAAFTPGYWRTPLRGLVVAAGPVGGCALRLEQIQFCCIGCIG